ncbi:hypothetical protein QTP86_013826, partial [Hemibagrus guttatus]
ETVIFTKLDLRNPYHLVRILSAGSMQMDPAKVEAVKDWLVPETRKALQQFLGFANFYWRFI